MDKKERKRRKRERKLRGAVFNEQQKQANIRAKYGPSMKPSPVTVIRDGEVVMTVDQDKLRRKRD